MEISMKNILNTNTWMFMSLRELCQQVVVTTHCKQKQEHKHKHQKEVADTLREDFYVDNLLKSAHDKQTAIKLMKDWLQCVQEGSDLQSLQAIAKMSWYPSLKGREEGSSRSGTTLPTEKALDKYTLEYRRR